MLGTSLTFLNYRVVSSVDFSLEQNTEVKKYGPWLSCFFGHQEVTDENIKLFSLF